jgi:hypothetical protein
MHLLTKQCRAGVLVPADAGDPEITAVVERYKDELQSANQRGHWVVRSDLGTMGALHIAADSVAADLLARIVRTASPRDAPPQNAGPPVRPRMTNRLDDQQAA